MNCLVCIERPGRHVRALITTERPTYVWLCDECRERWLHRFGIETVATSPKGEPMGRGTMPGDHVLDSPVGAAAPEV